MEAPLRAPARATLVVVLLLLLSSTSPLGAAKVQTANFVVRAPSQQLAQQLGEAAEGFRETLAVQWLGHELPQWDERCPIVARIDRGAGGETSFFFDRGRAHGWNMKIQGSPERMLDSVLPHEVTHTIFATHFGCPLPRWADEGACTTVEHPGEIARLEGELIKFLKTHRGIRFSDMMWMKQYPRDFMPLYAQGHSVAAYLIGLRGKQAFVRFIEDGLTDDNWPRAVKKHYGYVDLREMQGKWLAWVRAGRPPLATDDDEAQTRLVSITRPERSPDAARPVPQRNASSDDRPLAASSDEGLPRKKAASQPAAVKLASRLSAANITRPVARSPHETVAPVREAARDVRPVSRSDRVVFQWSAPTQR